jgi:hypothetical protein
MQTQAPLDHHAPNEMIDKWVQISGNPVFFMTSVFVFVAIVFASLMLASHAPAFAKRSEGAMSSTPDAKSPVSVSQAAEATAPANAPATSLESLTKLIRESGYSVANAELQVDPGAQGEWVLAVQMAGPPAGVNELIWRMGLVDHNSILSSLNVSLDESNESKKQALVDIQIRFLGR